MLFVKWKENILKRKLGRYTKTREKRQKINEKNCGKK